MDISKDAHNGGEESKDMITAEVDYVDKGYVMVMKTPKCPCL